MGICKKIKRTDLKWWQRLLNILKGQKEKNYGFIEIKGDDK